MQLLIDKVKQQTIEMKQNKRKIALIISANLISVLQPPFGLGNRVIILNPNINYAIKMNIIG